MARNVIGNGGPQGVSRRMTLKALAACAGFLPGLFANAVHASTCIPRGSPCSALTTCCGEAHCKWLDHNPFVGVCGGGRSTPHGIPSGVNARWSTPRGAVTCDDFVSQRDARHYLRRFGDRFNRRLDTDNDGSPCESLTRK